MWVGLDISTSVVGFCALNEDGSLCDLDHLDLKKELNFYKKVELFKDFIVSKTKNLSDIKFFVEEPLLMHSTSMAQVVCLLQRFNACCCFQLYSVFGHQPTLINVLSARKALGITIPKEVKKAKGTKHYIFDHVRGLKIVPEDHWMYKKTKKPKDWVYDECDAVVIAYSAYLKRHEEKGN